MLLLRHCGVIHCVDQHCSHMGADMAAADIEDTAGVQCLRCPWHGKRFDLETGREVVRAPAALSSAASGLCLSDATMHRVHAVHLLGDGFVYVDVASDGSVASDKFNVTSPSRHPATQASAAQQPAEWPSPGAASPSTRFRDEQASAASSPAPILVPYAGDLPIPPPPPPQCVTDGPGAFVMSSPDGAREAAAAAAAARGLTSPQSGLLAHAFKARRTAATSAVASRPTVPRTLFADPVADLAHKANLALHGPDGAAPRTWTGLTGHGDDMQMDG